MDFKKVKISPAELMILVILYVLGSAVLFLPSVLAHAAKQDAWIGAIVGTIGGILIVLFYMKLQQLYPDKSYIEAVTLVLGKWLGGFINVITIVYFFILCVILLWDIGNFLVTQVIVETPIEIIFILLTLTVIYGVRMGIENLARSAEIFIPWIFLLTFLSFIFLLPEANSDGVLPMLEDGIKPVFHAGYHIVAFPFLELLAFLLITPFVQEKEKVKKSFIIGVAFGGIILFLATLFCILVLGADVTANHEFPVYSLGKKISIGGFLERLEIIVAFNWFLSIYFKLAITFYFVVVAITQLAKLNDFRPLTLPVGMLLVVMTPIMITSSLYLQQFDVETFMPLTFVVCLFIPLIVYITAVIKKKKQTKQSSV